MNEKKTSKELTNAERVARLIALIERDFWNPRVW